MKINPYIAGNPVGGGEAFIGRADVLREVVRVLRSPSENALVLYGQRRIGKTSVLQHLAEWLPRGGAYHPVYFDLQDKAARPLAEVLTELAARVARELNLPPPEPWGEATPRVFREEFIPTVLAQLPAETSLVLLFDEFDVLDNPGEAQAGAAFFPYLRDLLSLDPRLQFIFVIGRRPEDLSSLPLSVFKGVKSRSVSLMSPEETAELVRLSERNSTLRWSDEAVARVYALTGGHPFLTQQLCQEIWERAYQDESEEPPTIQPAEVEAVVPATLRSATNALEWLWDGLKPAERVVASALAGAGPEAITQEELERQLLESGVRILVGELQDAPHVLQEWDLIEPAAGGYRFRVELLRRWIAERKPLARVQEEIDRIQPVADNLFQAAYNLYQAGQLEQATQLLRQAISFNPNHLRANQLLAEILLAQKEVTEARQLLESLYQYQPAAARPRLVQALLLQAQDAEEEEQLALYERILQLEPNQVEAITGIQQILAERSDAALTNNVKSAETWVDGLSGLSLAQEIGSETRQDMSGLFEQWTAPYIKPLHFEDILRLLRRGVSCLVIGLPRSGKTALLNQIRDELEADTKRCVFIDPTLPSDVSRLKEGQIYASDVHQANVILIDEIERVLNRDGLLVALRKLQSENGMTIVATAYQSREELIDGTNEVDAARLREMFGSEYYLYPWGREHVEDLFQTLNLPLRDDVIEYILGLTGGIPAFVISALEVWHSLSLEYWENKDEKAIEDKDIKKEVFVILVKDRSAFDGFWRALPPQHQRALLLSLLLHKIKETGTPLSKRQLKKIVGLHFSNHFDSASKARLLSEDKLIKSVLLQDWIQRLAFSEHYEDTVASIVRHLLSIDLTYANVMAEYFELLGAKGSATLREERQKYTVSSLNAIAQRVIGLMLILLSFWSILRLIGVLR